MTLDEFVKQYNGQYVDVDLYYGAQCWDLVELYAEKVLNVTKQPWAITLGPNGWAVEAWTVFDIHMQQFFDKIPGGQEQKGDIVVYGPHGVYVEGHIAICLNGTQVFEQNADPDHSPSHIFNRTPTYRLGALRRKGTPMPEVKVTREQIQDVGRSYFWEPDENYLKVWTGTNSFQNMWYDLSGQPVVKAALAAHFATPTSPKVLPKGDYRVE